MGFIQKGIDADLYFGDGSRRRVLITSQSLELARRAAMVMPSLFEGTGFNPLNAEASRVVAVARADHDLLHGCGREQQQAAFRLGQMDMREAAAQMLLDLSDGTQGVVCATLIDAAQRVRDLKLCDAIKENADGDT